MEVRVRRPVAGRGGWGLPSMPFQRSDPEGSLMRGAMAHGTVGRREDCSSACTLPEAGERSEPQSDSFPGMVGRKAPMIRS